MLDNQVDPTTGTIKLKASFPNEKLLLWPGAFVTVRLRVDTLHEATVVPPVAVQRGPRGAYVYVANDNKTVTRRPVTVGHENLTASVISDGLKPGERVVVDGAARLTDNAKINILSSAGAPPDGKPVGGGAPDATSSRPVPVARGQRNRGST